jgi:hypothetical protein
VPYSKYQVVASPLGTTVPDSFAEVRVIDLVEPVAVVGAPEVENVASAPRPVPASLVTTSR